MVDPGEKNIVGPDGVVAPHHVLRGAIAADLDEVMVCGWRKDGSLYAASSHAGSGLDKLVTGFSLARNGHGVTRQNLLDFLKEGQLK